MVRVPWSGSSSEEEARANLQARLTVQLKVMFWCFASLLGFLAALYEIHPALRPALNRYVFVAFAVGLVHLASIWRLLLVRRTLSVATLYALDAYFLIGTSTFIGLAAVLSVDRRPAAYACLLYWCFAILSRALIVPSTGTRTAVVTGIGAVPLAAAAVVLAARAQWPVPPGYVDVPWPAFVLGFAQIAVVGVLLAAAGSRIIYGLRRQVAAAQQLGQYTLGRKIGEGGMGAVHLAHHLMLRRPTAIKLLLPDRVGRENLERFEREVKHMSQLTHPNTVAVFDYGRSPDGMFYYAMEYLGGGIDLQQLVKQHGRQPAERVRQILIQVCGALHEAHERGLIHRDIKPANIILCERGGLPDVAKVVDFGLVKELTADAGSSQMILGTPAYLAPEAITEPSSVGPAADLYAVGAVGYFLSTGRAVFEGKTSVDVCVQHVTKAPVPPVGVPVALATLIMQCLAKLPAERPASSAALADALRAIGPLADWDEARAVAWWASFRPSEVVATSELSTALTIDMARREVAP